jgi:hypothetical protein
VTVEDIPGLIASALYPEGTDSHEVNSMLRFDAQEQHEKVLREAIREGELTTYSHAMIPFPPLQGDLPIARVPIDSFAQYAAKSRLIVRVNAASHPPTPNCDRGGALAPTESLHDQGSNSSADHASHQSAIEVELEALKVQYGPQLKAWESGTVKPDARRPKWSNWRSVPHVKLWEGVALSLDIDPHRVEHNKHGWMVNSHLFNESEDFKERLFVASRNLGGDGALRPTGITIGEPADCKISLSQFTVWAAALWEVPQEFQEIAALAEWASRDLWTITETVSLLKGQLPGSQASNHEEFDRMVEEIKLALKAGRLHIVGKQGNFLPVEHVRPSEIIRWASGRFPKFPFSRQDSGPTTRPTLNWAQKTGAQNEAPASDRAGSVAEKPLLTRERETALKLIIGMAVHGLGYDPKAAKSPIPREVAEKLDTLGLSLDPDTVRKWLRDAAELLPKNTDET